MDQQDWLQYVQQRARELQQTSTPRKRTQPKVTPMQSARMRIVSRQTNNPFKAGFVSAEDALAQLSGLKEAEGPLTRNVGPLDFGRNYVHGKDTGSR